MKSQLFIASVLFIILSALTSCSVPLSCILYNNTLTSLAIIQTSSNNKRTFHVDPNDVVEIPEIEFFNHAIQVENTELEYMIIDPGSDYWVFEGVVFPFVKRLVYFQIESDGRIYVIGEGQDFPIKITEKQPTGFPISPIRK